MTSSAPHSVPNHRVNIPTPLHPDLYQDHSEDLSNHRNIFYPVEVPEGFLSGNVLAIGDTWHWPGHEKNTQEPLLVEMPLNSVPKFILMNLILLYTDLPLHSHCGLLHSIVSRGWFTHNWNRCELISAPSSPVYWELDLNSHNSIQWLCTIPVAKDQWPSTTRFVRHFWIVAFGFQQRDWSQTNPLWSGLSMWHPEVLSVRTSVVPQSCF